MVPPGLVEERQCGDRSAFRGKHLCSIGDLGRDEILEIINRSHCLRSEPNPVSVRLTNLVVGLFFFQPSTRTRIGFQVAAARLGATTILLDAMRHDEGMSEAEDPYDAFRGLCPYFDLIVLRHRDEQEFLRMMAASRVPLINGGCGTRHHPTQALIDLFHAYSCLGRLDGLRWGIVGDLGRSRAARSLVDSLKHFEVSELRLMSPPDRRLPDSDLDRLPAGRIRHLDRLDLTDLDVIYMAGFPEGIGSNRAELQDRWRFRLTAERARKLSGSSLILNPLPRIDEIERAVDNLPQASYFKQGHNGQFVRMAILERFLSHQHGVRMEAKTSESIIEERSR